MKWNVFTWSIDRQKYSVRPRRGVQESTLRWHEYQIHLQSPTPSQITRQGRMLTQDNKIRDGISPSKMGQDGLDSTNSSLLYQRIFKQQLSHGSESLRNTIRNIHRTKVQRLQKEQITRQNPPSAERVRPENYRNRRPRQAWKLRKQAKKSHKQT